MTPDRINGFFEFTGAMFLFLNVKILLRDKQIKGISVLPTIFYSSWGLWNLYFYPSLNQMWSFYGGIFVALANITWVILALKYKLKE